ncbi:LuxR C-terminal-related transcriptional regulator [Novosphingobium panipatense]|uniref:LuxR C-terminal-related transcriptional regulator n=1 Tax=Novosphingobium panipatense TaxID=428991 RepID=UPI00361FCC79
MLHSTARMDDLEPRHLGQGRQHTLVIERDLLPEEARAAVARLQRAHPSLRIVVLTQAFDFDEMITLYSAGAYAYFPQDVPYLSLVAVLQMVANGQKVAPPQVIDFLVSMPAAARPEKAASQLARLNLRDRERLVLLHLANGLSNKAISREIRISEAAVKAGVKAILRKLGVSIERRLLSSHGSSPPPLGWALLKKANHPGPIAAPTPETPMASMERRRTMLDLGRP